MDKVLRNTAATLSVTFYNGTSAVEADGVVTVTAKKADGTTLLSTNATNDPAVGVYTVVLPPQASLNLLTLQWTGSFTGTPITIESNVEIVGGFYFSLAELRAYDSTLANTTKYPNDLLALARDQVEAEFEDICHRAFVPRFYRETGVVMDADEEMLWLEKPEINTFTAFKLNNVDYLSWVTAGFFARDKFSPHGVRVYRDALNIFAYDWYFYNSPVVVEYEYGMKTVPVPIKQKALKRAKQFLAGLNTTIDERALTMTLPDIGTINLATPGQRGSETGVPDIDVVLQRYTLDGGAGVF